MGKGSTRRPAQVPEWLVESRWILTYGGKYIKCDGCNGFVQMDKAHESAPGEGVYYCYGCYLERKEEIEK